MHRNPVKLKQVSNFQQVLQILKSSQVPQQMKVSQVRMQNFSVYTPEDSKFEHLFCREDGLPSGQCIGLIIW